MRLGEFNTDFRHQKVKDMVIANGLARVPYEQPWTWQKDWEDIHIVNVVENRSLADRGLIVGDSAIIIYADGTCRGNGTPEARASVGIYAGPGYARNQGFEIHESDQRLTNQVAELFALIYAVQTGVEIVRTGGQFTMLVIVTDSVCA